MNLYLYTPKTFDKEIDESIVFATPKALAAHLINTAKSIDEKIFNNDDEKVKLKLRVIERKLSNGNDLFIGKNQTFGAGLVVNLSKEGHSCLIYKFVNADSLSIDDETFCRNITNENPELTSKYLSAKTNAEREEILKENKDVILLDFEDENGTRFEVTFGEIALNEKAISFHKVIEF